MPPDTTYYIPGQTGLPSSSGGAYADSLIHSLGEDYQPAPVKEKPQFLFPQWELFLFVLIAMLVSGYFYVIRPSRLTKKKRTNIYKDGAVDSTVIEMQYDQWLNQYNPYYKQLPAGMKKRFLERVIEFKQLKEFRYHFMTQEEYIPVLISGAAVQLTFGLKHYLIEYFPVIHIIKKEYTIPDHDDVFEGHVSKRSICISWNHFLEGYANYTDSENVGLHELAHAVSFDVFYGNNENGYGKLRKRLKEYVHEAEPVFKALGQGKNHTLDEYATTNFEEFWAVSIETFFENPEEFRDKMPGLYESIGGLLNQDPLLPGIIINKEIAGLVI